MSMMAGRQCISIIKLQSARLLQLQTRNLARTQISASARCAKLSTSSPLYDDSKSLKLKDPKLITLDDAAKSVEDLAHDAALKGLITVEGPADITTVSVS
jgi:hypothetical protein